MKTEDLVELLARGTVAVDPRVPRRHLAIALTAGAVLAVLLMALTLGLRPDLGTAGSDPMFWVKLAFPAAIALCAVPLCLRLARPGSAVGRWPWGVALPILAIWLLGAAVALRADPPQRAQLFWGDTWAVCPLSITLLSMPVFVLLLRATRSLAPTRPRTIGAVIGLLSGAIGAVAYALHCPETAAPFLAVWYVLGLVTPAVLGAAIGPRVLRW